MTGFARAQGRDDALDWVWEAKSVNARGLDLRFRLPPGFERLEIAARGAAANHFKRGSIALTLTLGQAAAAGRYRVNADAVAELAAVAADLARRTGLAPASLDGLLALRGVVEPADQAVDEDALARREAAIAATLEEALSALARMRHAEGERLLAVLVEQLGGMDRLRDAALRCAAAQPEALRARLQAQLAELLEAMPPLPEERLAQEAALLVSRTDVREELDRFAAHVAAARELLQAGGAVGRRLDFLCQELNREANTLCSKSADLELTGIGLEIKAVVEQFREQVQNIE